jgi:hypothetical protein
VQAIRYPDGGLGNKRRWSESGDPAALVEDLAGLAGVMPAQILSWAYRNCHFRILVGLGQYDEGPQILVAAPAKSSYEEAGTIGFFRERGQPKLGRKEAALLAHCRNQLDLELEALQHVTTQQTVQELCHFHASRGSLGFSPDREAAASEGWANQGQEEDEESPDEEQYGSAAPAKRTRARTGPGKKDKLAEPKVPAKTKSRKGDKNKEEEVCAAIDEEEEAAPSRHRLKMAVPTKAKKSKIKAARRTRQDVKTATSSSDPEDEDETTSVDEATGQQCEELRSGRKEGMSKGNTSSDRKHKDVQKTKEAKTVVKHKDSVKRRRK